MKLSQVILKRNKPRIILSNGSERGDFIPLDYIYSRMNRIHDGIQMMKTYYPYDSSWSDREKISSVTSKKNVTYAWDYEYEDYHPFNIWTENSETLREIEQVKLFGADLHLSITLDLALSDESIAAIGRSLIPYGNVFLRINHEANGYWFRYNTMYTYKEVSYFFVRCHNIIKANAPNVKTVFNITADIFMVDKIVKNRALHLSQVELQDALNIADYWSIDKYVSLNWGWPFEKTITPDSKSYFKGSVDDWWRLTEETYLSMIWSNRLCAKPLFINEFNADSDIDGYDGQASIISDVYNRIAEGDYDWIAGITLYQFRDLGGLGLEKGTIDSFESLPALKSYQQAIQRFRYSVTMSDSEWEKEYYAFSWNTTDCIKGLHISNFTGQRFTNKFEVPVFVITGDEQCWNRIDVNNYCYIENEKEFMLFIPPYKKDNTFRYSTAFHTIRKNLNEMII